MVCNCCFDDFDEKEMVERPGCGFLCRTCYEIIGDILEEEEVVDNNEPEEMQGLQ